MKYIFIRALWKFLEMDFFSDYKINQPNCVLALASLLTHLQQHPPF